MKQQGVLPDCFKCLLDRANVFRRLSWNRDIQEVKIMGCLDTMTASILISIFKSALSNMFSMAFICYLPCRSNCSLKLPPSLFSNVRKEKCPWKRRRKTRNLCSQSSVRGPAVCGLGPHKIKDIVLTTAVDWGAKRQQQRLSLRFSPIAIIPQAEYHLSPKNIQAGNPNLMPSATFCCPACFSLHCVQETC